MYKCSQLVHNVENENTFKLSDNKKATIRKIGHICATNKSQTNILNFCYVLQITINNFSSAEYIYFG